MNLLPGVSNLANDLLMFLPELVVTVAIVVLLLMRMVRGLDRLHLGGVALALTVVALFVSGYMWWDDPKSGGETQILGSMLVYDGLTSFLRMLILSATALTILLTLQTGIPDRE